MYTLRIIKKDKHYGVSNIYLGNGYIVSKKQEGESNLAFVKNFKQYFEIPDSCDVAEQDEQYQKIYTFVSGNNGSVLLPIYYEDYAFIMTESGKTFEKLN